jgi:hypothetical protein
MDTGIGDVDIFAQKYNSSGQPQWQEPAQIVVKPGLQEIHQLIATSDNSFVLTYGDESDLYNRQLWAQKFNSNGQKLWTSVSDYGVQLNTASYDSSLSYAVPNATGGLYVIIKGANPSNNVIGYQIDALGTNMWDANGLSLFSHTSSVYPRCALTDFAGGMILQVDKYVSNIGMRTHLLRISPAGTVVGQNPMISSNLFQGSVFNISSSTQGTYFLTALDWTDTNALKMQKMDNQGNLLFPVVQSFAISSSLDADTGIVTSPTNDGGLVYAWKVNTASSNSQLYMQRLDNNLLPMWQQGGVILNTDDDKQYSLSISINDTNGIWATWLSMVGNTYLDFTVEAQYVSPSGIVAFPVNTIDLSSSDGSKGSPLCLASNDSAMFFWKDESGEQTGIRRQVLSTGGTAYLGEFGAPVVSYLSGNPQLSAVEAFDTGYITFWTDDRIGGTQEVYYQIINNQQAMLLEENGRSLAEFSIGYSVIRATHRLDGNMVAVLYSNIFYPNGNNYLQVINSNGEKLYPGYGLSLGDNIGSPSMSCEGENIFLAWRSDVNQGTTFTSVLKGQRILNGQMMWDAGGKTIASFGQDIYPENIKVSGRYFLWVQADYINYAYVSKVLLVDENGNPAPGWEATGLALTTTTPGISHQLMFAGISEGNLVAFLQREERQESIRIQKISATGQRLWGDEGLTIESTPNQTMVLDADFSGGLSCIYLQIGAESLLKLQKFDSNGNRLFGADGLLISPVYDYWYPPQLVKYQNDCYSVIWTNTVDSDLYNTDVYQRQISPDGVAGEIQTICNAPLQQLNLKAAESNNSAFVAWDDNRAGIQILSEKCINSIYGTVIQSSNTAVADELIVPGAAISNHRNYPNPFNPSTTLSFELTGKRVLNLDIYNIKGQKVRSLATNQYFAEGKHSLVWDGRDNSGKTLSSGVYMYKLQTATENVSGKMLMLK